jgi:hypothetical protein
MSNQNAKDFCRLSRSKQAIPPKKEWKTGREEGKAKGKRESKKRMVNSVRSRHITLLN